MHRYKPIQLITMELAYHNIRVHQKCSHSQLLLLILTLSLYICQDTSSIYLYDYTVSIHNMPGYILTGSNVHQRQSGENAMHSSHELLCATHSSIICVWEPGTAAC